MKYVFIEKADVAELINYMGRDHKIVAPVKKENSSVFDSIEDPSDISLDGIPTILPPKKYFIPQIQELFTFKMGEAAPETATVDIEPIIIFGARTCDIEVIEYLDVVLNEEPHDPYFRERKKAITIIGYECMDVCDEWATCVTMQTHIPRAGYDIMITDVGEKYILHINSSEGNDLIEHASFIKNNVCEKIIKSELLKHREEKLKKFKPRLTARYNSLHAAFEGSNHTDIWEKIANRCVSCGNCTVVCPTCYCFDICDEVELNMNCGRRYRVWDSCQLEDFAAVSNGGNFRKQKTLRQRHRYSRKFNYSVKKYNKFSCVGCGRCSRVCMAGISLIETVNELTKEWENA